MQISAMHHGNSILQTAQRMTNEASSSLASSDLLSQNAPSINKTTSTNEIKTSSNVTDELIKLKTAETYNQIGANVVQRSNDMMGSILDITT